MFKRETNTKWTLVLPPWVRLPHWNDEDGSYDWSQFFDVKSLNDYIPVVELRQFTQTNQKSGNMIDVVYHLQNYKQTLTDADFKWTEKANIDQCHNLNFYYKVREQ